MVFIRGLDVSQIQGTIDWTAVAAQGYEFVFLRCYVGNNGPDNMYQANLIGAAAAGLKVGAYMFAFPLPENGNASRSPQAQAAAHFAAAGNVPVVALDLEWPISSDFGKWGCSPSQIVDWVIAYMQAYQALSGIQPILYTYPYYMEMLNNDPRLAQYKLWIASYENSPDIPAPWSSWVIWQNSGGTGAGATHLPSGAPVDTDYAQDLSLWETISTVVSVPPPAPVPMPDPVAAPSEVVVADPTPIPTQL
jgi:lysozyme